MIKEGVKIRDQYDDLMTHFGKLFQLQNGAQMTQCQATFGRQTPQNAQSPEIGVCPIENELLEVELCRRNELE